MAAAYSQGRWLLAHFHDMCAAAQRAARSAPVGRVGFQGHVLAVEDFLAMWTVEFTIHHLDLLVGLPGLAAPTPEAIELVAVTLDGLLEAQRPDWWNTKPTCAKAPVVNPSMMQNGPSWLSSPTATQPSGSRRQYGRPQYRKPNPLRERPWLPGVPTRRCPVYPAREKAR
jgi:hypothetical protein